MSDDANLRHRLIRLAHADPDLRPHLLPILREAASGDPRWIDAKFPGKAKDGTPFRKGDRILYYPNDRTILVGEKAEKAWLDFQAGVADEDFYNFRGASSEHEAGRDLAYNFADVLAAVKDARVHADRGHWALAIRELRGLEHSRDATLARLGASLISALDDAAYDENPRLPFQLMDQVEQYIGNFGPGAGR